MSDSVINQESTIVKMTVFYKLRTKEIDAICSGEQDLKFYNDLDSEDAALIYGYIIIDYDEYILRSKNYFELVEGENNQLILKMKEEYQETLKKYITE